MNSEIEKIQQEMDVMLAMISGQTVIISSLIRTHPSFEAFQTDLAGLLELFLNGAGSRSLTDSQRNVTRLYVEALQNLHSHPTPIAADLLTKFRRG